MTSQELFKHPHPAVCSSSNPSLKEARQGSSHQHCQNSGTWARCGGVRAQKTRSLKPLAWWAASRAADLQYPGLPEQQAALPADGGQGLSTSPWHSLYHSRNIVSDSRPPTTGQTLGNWRWSSEEGAEMAAGWSSCLASRNFGDKALPAWYRDSSRGN